MRTKHLVQTIDSHTGGEPTRLVVSGIPVAGSTIVEQRDSLIARSDWLVRSIMREPRGHRGMFGALITPAVNAGSDFGIIWLGNGPYLDMCGHGTIGIGATVVEAGLVPVSEPVTHVRVDMPAGVVAIAVDVADGRAMRVAFTNVPAFVWAQDLAVDVPGLGRVPFDISFGGNFFAAVRAEAIGIPVREENVRALVDAGMAIRAAVNQNHRVVHPLSPHIASVELVTIYGEPLAPGAKYKNIHVFGEGQFDRSPGGTGTSHMMAVLHARGLMRRDEAIISEGITGSTFGGRIVETTTIGGRAAIVPEISGRAFVTGLHQFIVDPDDPLPSGFLL